MVLLYNRLKTINGCIVLCIELRQSARVENDTYRHVEKYIIPHKYTQISDQ